MMLRKLSMLPGERSDATLALIALKNCDGREKIDPKQIIREDLHEQTVFQHLLIYL